MNPELLNQFIEAAKRVPGWLVHRIETEEIPNLIAMLEVDTYPHPIGIGKALEAWAVKNDDEFFEGFPFWVIAGGKKLVRYGYRRPGDGTITGDTRLEAAMKALIACYGEEAS